MPDDVHNKSIYMRNSDQIVSRAEVTTDRTRGAILRSEFYNALIEGGKSPRITQNTGNFDAAQTSQTTISLSASFGFAALPQLTGALGKGYVHSTWRFESNFFQTFRRDYDLSYSGFLYADQTGRSELDHDYTENTLPPNKVFISEGNHGLDEGTIDNDWPKFPNPQKDDFYCTGMGIAGNFQAFKKTKSQILPSNLNFHTEAVGRKFAYTPGYVKSTDPAADYTFRYLDDKGGYHHQESYYDGYDNVRKGSLNFFGGRKITPTYNSTSGLIEKFTIINNDGFKYEFGIPVYQYDEYSEISDNNSAATKTPGDKFASTSTTDDGSLGNNPFYASEWLLTQITGPDYVDADNSGKANFGDRGYWIKFSYTRTTDNYDFRYPFSFREVPPEYSVSSNHDNASGGAPIKLSNALQYGRRDVYYLRNVESASHIAVFEISKRQDAYEHGNPAEGLKSLGNDAMYRLDEILLYDRAAIGSDANQNGLVDKNEAASKPVKRVLLTFDYHLSNGVPNSKAGGKLTLNALQIADSSFNVAFPYEFTYYDDYSYNEMHFDRWGYHKSDATYDGHLAVKPDDVKAWSLKKIIQPTGGDLTIEYESDKYNWIYDKNVRGTMDIYNDHKEPYETFGYRNGEIDGYFEDRSYFVKKSDFQSKDHPGGDCYDLGSDITHDPITGEEITLYTPKLSCYSGFWYNSDASYRDVSGVPHGFIDGKNRAPNSNFFQRLGPLATDCADANQSFWSFSAVLQEGCTHPIFNKYDFRGYNERRDLKDGTPPPDIYKTQSGVIQIRHSGYGDPTPVRGQNLVITVGAHSIRQLRETEIDANELPSDFKIDEIDAYAMVVGSSIQPKPQADISILGFNGAQWTNLATYTLPSFSCGNLPLCDHKWIRVRHTLTSANSNLTKFRVVVNGVNGSGTARQIGQKDFRVYFIDHIKP